MKLPKCMFPESRNAQPANRDRLGSPTAEVRGQRGVFGFCPIEVEEFRLGSSSDSSLSAAFGPRPHWCGTLWSRTKKPGRALRRSVGLVLMKSAAAFVRSAADEQAVGVLGIGAEDFDLAMLCRSVAVVNDKFGRTRQ